MGFSKYFAAFFSKFEVALTKATILMKQASGNCLKVTSWVTTALLIWPMYVYVSLHFTIHYKTLILTRKVLSFRSACDLWDGFLRTELQPARPKKVNKMEIAISDYLNT